MADVNEDFVADAKAGGWYSEALMQRIAEMGHIHFDEVPEELRRVFVTAHDVTPEWHIRMQGAFQEFTDSAISKTCNFPEAATQDDVRQIYELAYSLGCKGVTVYRDNSRPMQVLSTGRTAKGVAGKEAAVGAGPLPAAERELAETRGQLAELEAELERVRRQLHESEAENAQRRLKRSRPDLLRGMTRRIETPLGTAYVTITEDELGQPFEVFISLGKAGAPLMADVEAIGRLISLALRSGIPMAEVHRQLRGISSDRVIGLGPNKVMSVPDAIGIAIEKWMREKHEGVQQELLSPQGRELKVARPVALNPGPAGTQAAKAGTDVPNLLGACPDCGSQLEFAEGCVKCHVCGYSECG
jgi:ribonucleoside-diphosphate reductase alpha chain